MKASSDLRVALTGDERFATRHGFLFIAIAEKCGRLDYVTSSARSFGQRFRLLFLELAFATQRITTGQSGVPLSARDIRHMRRRFIMSRTSFEAKSRFTQRNLSRLTVAPQIVLHIFGLYRPFWKPSATPFAQYVDYTTALARRNWPTNLPQLSDGEHQTWFELERSTYRAAAHIFAMSGLAARSLAGDYGVSPDRITVVGSGGNYPAPFEGRKKFGTKQLLFNANPFERKGGDIVLSAFEMVRREIPDATLVVVGLTLDATYPGVSNPGFVTSEALRHLFLSSDLVLAPARADPFPGFLIEAMSHGVPCVASKVDGVPEIVDDTVNGILLESPTADSVARTVLGLLGDVTLLERLSAAALEKARKRFAWSAIADRIVEQLAAVVAAGASSEKSAVAQKSAAAGVFRH